MLKRLWIVLSIAWAVCVIGIGWSLEIDEQATRESLARSAAAQWAPGPAPAGTVTAAPIDYGASIQAPPLPAGAIPIQADPPPPAGAIALDPYAAYQQPANDWFAKNAPPSLSSVWAPILAVAFAPFVGGPILAWIAAWVWAGRKQPGAAAKPEVE